jgi:hypothetical protein
MSNIRLGNKTYRNVEQFPLDDIAKLLDEVNAELAKLTVRVNEQLDRGHAIKPKDWAARKRLDQYGYFLTQLAREVMLKNTPRTILKPLARFVKHL